MTDRKAALSATKAWLALGGVDRVLAFVEDPSLVEHVATAFSLLEQDVDQFGSEIPRWYDSWHRLRARLDKVEPQIRNQRRELAALNRTLRVNAETIVNVLGQLRASRDEQQKRAESAEATLASRRAPVIANTPLGMFQEVLADRNRLIGENAKLRAELESVTKERDNEREWREDKERLLCNTERELSAERAAHAETKATLADCADRVHPDEHAAALAELDQLRRNFHTLGSAGPLRDLGLQQLASPAGPGDHTHHGETHMMAAAAAAPVLAAMDAALEEGNEPTMSANAQIAAVDGVTEQEPKHTRKKPVQISVRYDERELDQLTQLKLHTLRSEITALNRSLRERNSTIQRLRADSRTYVRVMRLKSEARQEAIATHIDKALEDRMPVSLQTFGGKPVGQIGG